MIRFATENDIEIIGQLIRGLAEYEKLPHEVSWTLEQLKHNLFGPRRCAEVLLAEDDATKEIVGFALFFHNFSTFVGKPGIYLEDLFVKPERRGQGWGKALLRRLAQLAIERDCGRLEWWVLDWNQPAINFYKSLGAGAMDQWTVYRMSGEALAKLASARSPNGELPKWQSPNGESPNGE